MQLTEVFTDEDGDVMATQQEGLDEGKSVDGEFFGNSFNDDVAEGKGAFMLCGEDASRPFTPASHHNHFFKNVFDDGYFKEKKGLSNHIGLRLITALGPRLHPRKHIPKTRSP